MADRVNGLLLPIVKGMGSERSYECLAESLQILGGAGYLKDRPLRAVHPRRQDRLAVRGHHRDPGAGLLLPQDRPRPGRGARSRRGADRGLPATSAGARRTGGRPRAARHGAGRRAGDGRRADGLFRQGRQRTSRGVPRRVESVPFLLAVGDLLIGWLLLWHAEIALAALDRDPSERDRAYYRGKVAAARFFATQRAAAAECRAPDRGDRRPRRRWISPRRPSRPRHAARQSLRACSRTAAARSWPRSTASMPSGPFSRPMPEFL